MTQFCVCCVTFITTEPLKPRRRISKYLLDIDEKRGLLLYVISGIVAMCIFLNPK